LLRDTFESGKAEFIRHRPAPAAEGDGDPGWDLYRMCETVALASWQSSVASGNTLTHDRVRDYFHAAHAAAARIGMVDVNLMLVDGRPAAFLYGYHCLGRITALRTGYDASIGSGTGSVMLLKSLQDSCQRGDRSIDFGPGEREHKRRLRTRVEATYRLTYTPISSWRSQTVRWTRWAKNRWPKRAAANVAAASVAQAAGRSLAS
jgi:CelD/BcsL family acetyltransferase involved in cellulose biosynthesis